MKTKTLVCFMFTISIVLFNSIIVMAGEIPKEKLGYGFEPGLVAGKDFVEGQLIVGF